LIRPKGLGRGLDALLAGADEPSAAEALQTLAIERVQPGKYQPRTAIDEASLDELASSIREHGIMQPILVRPRDDGRFEIIAGERRWRAAKVAGLSHVPALVKAVPDEHALALALIENIQREDLNPLEQANGIHRLIEEFGMTHDGAAKAVGRSRSAVTNLLRLRELAKPVQVYLSGGQLAMGHARALLALSAGQQTAAAARVVAQGLSVRETERLVRHFAHGGRQSTKRSPREVDPDLARLQQEISESIGAKVTIEPRASGGKLVIEYSSLEELDGILAKLR
jgi:ParB family chromosome partitioning protein